MSELATDPFAGGLSAFALDVRSSSLSIEAATTASLQRAEKLDPSLQAFEHIDKARAIKTAVALDQLSLIHI